MSTTITSKDGNNKAKFYNKGDKRNNKSHKGFNGKPYRKYDPIFYRINLSKRSDYDDLTMERIRKIVKLITNDAFINTFSEPNIIRSVLRDKTIRFKMEPVGSDQLTFDAYYGELYIGVSLAVKYTKSKDPNKDLDIEQKFRVVHQMYDKYLEARKEQA